MGELETAISISNLSFSYENNQVLDEISAEIKASRLTVILGKNGSGKSTLLRIIAGITPYQNGEIFIGNESLRTIRLSKRAKRLGFLGQKHKAVFPFTVEEVVLTGRAGYVKIVPTKQDKLKAIDAIKKVNILHLINRIYTELSGGEQQLVMIARVLAQEPKIVLLDEPTAHLDFSNQIKILSLLRELTSEKLTVVAVLHDPGIAFLYGNDFLFVQNGKLIKPHKPIKPWDAGFLQTIYEHELESVPYGKSALIAPRLD